MLRRIRSGRSDSHREQDDWRLVSRGDYARVGLAVDSDGGFTDCGGAGILEACSAAVGRIHRERSRESEYSLVFAVGGGGKAARIGVERGRAVCLGECAEAE